MNSKNIFYILACISYCLIIGAAVYEHIAVWPVAFSEPPRSLTMFQGNYAIEPALFWKFIHPVTLTLFIITLGLNWKTERKKFILTQVAHYSTNYVKKRSKNNKFCSQNGQFQIDIKHKTQIINQFLFFVFSKTAL